MTFKEYFGTSGNDTLTGSYLTTDFFFGSLGNDTYIIQDADDSIQELVNMGLDTVKASLNYTLGSNLENLTLMGDAFYGEGNELNNTITGNLLHDVQLFGRGGNDILLAGSGNDALIGDEGNDKLTGGAGNDVLDGGAGNDVLNGGTGQDYMMGGTGNDTYYVDSSNELANEYNGDGIDKVIASVDYVLNSGIENLTLTENASNGYGNELNNVMTGNLLSNNNLFGYLGNDVLLGGASNDFLAGDEGNDKLSGGAGYDNLDGGAGNDTLDGGAGQDFMHGGAGNDTYYVDDSNDMIDEAYGSGTDKVISSASYYLNSGIENLTLTGTATFGYGNELNNVIGGNLLNDVHLYGFGGNDILTGGSGNDELTGGDGNDKLTASAGFDFLSGGNGNDTLDGGTGQDYMMGGSGNDTYYVDDNNDITDESYSDGIDKVISSAEHYELSNGIENLTLTGNSFYGGGNQLDNNISSSSLNNVQIFGGFGNDVLLSGAGNDLLIGDEGDDRLTGGAGNDLLDGGNGDDTLTGGIGQDFMHGGAGNDTYYVDDTNDAIDESYSDGTDNVISNTDLYVLSNGIENLTLTGNAFYGAGNDLDNIIYSNSLNNIQMFGYYGDDVLRSGSGHDSLDGGDGNDLLTGGAGSDILSGGTGDDTLNGGADIDYMHGGTGDDTYYVDTLYEMVYEFHDEGVDKVISSIDLTLSGDIENLTLTGNALYGYGNAMNNSISANLLNNVSLYGDAGDDTLSSGAGNDHLEGGEGDDLLTGGSGHDFLKGAAGDDTLNGGDGDDILEAGTGTDVLNGGAGDDKLFSGGGDVMTGGLGIDIFAGNLSDSTIRDFQKGIDLIRFDVYEFSPTHSGTFTFIGQQAFTDTDQLRFEKVGTSGVLYGNVDGDLAADFQVTLTGVTTIDIADLQLV